MNGGTGTGIGYLGVRPGLGVSCGFASGVGAVADRLALDPGTDGAATAGFGPAGGLYERMSQGIPAGLRLQAIIGCPRPMLLVVACDDAAWADRRRA